MMKIVVTSEGQVETPLSIEELAQQELDAITASTNTVIKAWSNYKNQARDALEKSDITILRCVEKLISIPSEWTTYRETLRDIISVSSGDPNQPLPVKPIYPVGS